MLYQNISYLQFRVLSPINSKLPVWATRTGSCCCCCCPLSLPYGGNGILSTTSSPHNLFTTFISLHQNTGTVWSATDLIMSHIETASAAKECGLKSRIVTICSSIILSCFFTELSKRRTRPLATIRHAVKRYPRHNMIRIGCFLSSSWWMSKRNSLRVYCNGHWQNARQDPSEIVRRHLTHGQTILNAKTRMTRQRVNS